ncbi:MAG: RnfH family protein [Vitreoscilla sp.]|nr:RnfH family protein [Vitreoscilla sp.]
MANKLTVEVVYATKEQQYLVGLEVDAGTTALAAVQLSGLYTQFPHTQDYPMGIFGKAVPADTVLEDHDRVELYRPLLIDPKENRRRRAAKNKENEA